MIKICLQMEMLGIILKSMGKKMGTIHSDEYLLLSTRGIIEQDKTPPSGWKTFDRWYWCGLYSQV